MANTKSALKRIQVAERNRLRNKSYKSAVKTLTKRYHEALETHIANPSSESEQRVQENLSAAVSKIDKAVKRGVLHKNTGARKKSQLSKVLKSRTGTALSDAPTSDSAPAVAETPEAATTAEATGE
ncbi:MAG: 30S ribosomal protein S20 [Phormidesmis sp.]